MIAINTMLSHKHFLESMAVELKLRLVTYILHMDPDNWFDGPHEVGLFLMLQEQTSYPVYSDHSHHSSHTIIEQAAIQNALSNHLNDYSNGMTNSETRTPGAHTCTPHLGSHSVGFVLNGDTGAVAVPGSASTDRTVNLHQGKKKSSSGDTSIDKSVPPSIIIRSDRDNIEDEMKNLRLSTDDHRSHHSRQNSQQVGLYTTSPSHAQIGQSQIIAQGVTHSQNTGDHVSHGQPKLPSVEMQPLLQSAGTVPSLYVPGAGYGAPYYHNLQFPSVLPLQFGIGGYTLNPSLVSPLVTAYPPHHSAMPMPFDNVVGPNFSARASGISTGGNAVPGVDMQQLYKIYGQLGLAIQPPFSDPLYMPFYQHYSTDALAAAGQYDSKISRGSAVGSPAGTYDLQKGPGSSAYLPEQRPSQVMGVGGVNTLNAIKGVTISPGYYGNPPNMGLLMQFPGSPLASPVSQGSPVARTSFSGRKNDNTKFPFSSERITGSSGCSIQRGGEKVDDPISYSFLEELKSNKARRYDLSDIAGRIVEFRQVLIFLISTSFFIVIVDFLHDVMILFLYLLHQC